MSFINLMANDVWSEADIVAKTEALIHTHFSKEQELILNRKATGVALSQYTLSAAEMLELQNYAAKSHAARLEGEAARADMQVLAQVLALEAAMQQLALVLDDAVAQAVIDTASVAAVQLYSLRNPEPAL